VPRSDDPPRVRWSEPVDPSAAVLEFSTDHFVTLLFSTAWWEVPVDSDGWQIPGQLWQRAPGDRTIFWRLVTRGGSSTAQLASGRIAPRSTGPTTAGRHPRTAAC
jgi:hypothetical protein